MAKRFFALACPGDAPVAARLRNLKQAAAALSLNCIFECPRLVVFATIDTQAVLIGQGAGVIVGDLFSKEGDYNRVKSLDGTALHISETCGEALAQNYWGSYVACLTSKKSTYILRDPSGTVPCLQTVEGGIHFFFSHIDDGIQIAGLKPKINRSSLARHLAFETFRDEATCLEGIRELLPAMRCKILPQGANSDYYWTAWDFASRDRQIVEYEEATTAVRDAVLKCTRALGRDSQRPTVELSGGLDSSIVAVCLGQCAPNLSAITLVMPDPRADERRYAKLVADQIRATFLQSPLTADFADITRLPDQRIPRPPLGVLSLAVDQAIINATGRQTDAFFSGVGGDDVFCFLDNAGSVADALLTFGPSHQAFTAASELATIHHSTFWKALWYGIKKARRGPRPPVADYSFLQQVHRAEAPSKHPGLVAPAGILPGKYDHCAALVGTHSRLEGVNRLAIAPMHFPLLCQPVVETCLRIPSWMWTRGGRNRAVARDAFATVLPTQIAHRQTKGDFSSFNWEIYERNSEAMRELLLTGFLASGEIIDVRAIESQIAEGTEFSIVTAGRLVRLAAAEVWARSWI